MVEVVVASKTSTDVLAASMAICRKIQKIAVAAGVCYGFIGNRILFQRQREAQRLVQEDGLMPWDVDRVLLQFGFPMGPFQMGDLAGLDIGWSKETSMGRNIQERLCELDRRGQKTGKGYYDYDDTRVAKPSEVTREVIRKFRADKGFTGNKEYTESEILERLLLPMVNEAAEVLEQGKALRASDIDGELLFPSQPLASLLPHLLLPLPPSLPPSLVMYCNGYGFPKAKGGLLFFADHIGLPYVLSKLKEMERTGGAMFKPCALLEKLVREGKKFGDLPPGPRINPDKVETRIVSLL